MDSESTNSNDARLEVEVTLNPFDNSAVHDVRTFHLNRENRKVDVGRASRNLSRDYQPSGSNAAFRCPIMSRKHAQFTASPIHKVLYVEDLGSTHGTFVGDKKISKGVKTTLKSGDIVTFGTSVANGSAVFTGKKVRVEYKWQPRYSSETSNNVTRVIRVPDSDNDDEEIAARSREPSIEIVESNMRNTTYSVPDDSDGDSVSDKSEDVCKELASAPHTPQSKDKESPITSPDELDLQPGVHVVVDNKSSSKVTNLRLKPVPVKTSGEGSSQHNPIDLEENKIHTEDHNLPARKSLISKNNSSIWDFFKSKRDSNETDSDEEGPDVLPNQSPGIKSSTKRSHISDLLNEKPAAGIEAINADHHITRLPRSDSTSPTRDQIERIIRGAQDRVTRDEAEARETRRGSFDLEPDLPPTKGGSTAGVAGSEDDRVNDSEEDEENEHEVDDEEAEEDDDLFGNRTKERDDYDFSDEEEDRHNKIMEDEESGEVDNKENDQDMDEDFPIDTDEADLLEKAAMSGQDAEKGKSKVDSAFPYSRMVEPEVVPQVRRDLMRNLLRTPSPSDAALAKEAKGVRSSPHRNVDTSSKAPMHSCIEPFHSRNEYLPNTDGHAIAFDSTEQHWLPANNSPSCRHTRYTTGPFAMNGPAEGAFSHLGPVSAGAEWDSRSVEYDDYGIFGKKSSMSIAFALNEMDKTNSAEVRKIEAESRSTEDQSAKLHISNLVNSHHAEPVRSSKRKAAEISVDLEDKELENWRVLSSAIQSDELAHAPDAQPRELNPFATESSASLDSMALPTANSITIMATETSHIEEPARKKAKVTSPAGGIGKFLLGVGVGAVGFAAAFLATIPASVQEEALRGL